MVFSSIVLIILFSFLRKKLKTIIPFPEWDKYFQIGFYVAIGLLLAQVLTPIAVRPYIVLISFGFLFALFYLLFTRKQFKPILYAVYAFLPITAISFVESLAKLISPSFYTTWKSVFDTAGVFGFIWLGAIFIYTNKQVKALEKERLKSIEQEKELKLTTALKAELEIQVAERTADLTAQKLQLEQTLLDLTNTQKQLIQSEKMASLGELTAGIAHEIQNPLNFVNNFSEVSAELVDEMNEEIAKGNTEEVAAIAKDLKENLEKINHHGKRAGDIVKGMLQHSRKSGGVKEPTDINALADEYLRLAYHGLRAKDKSFNAKMITDFDQAIGKIDIIPQDIGRVILNLITNAFYVVNEKAKAAENYEPSVSVSTKKIGNKVFVNVKDNGTGIPPSILDKIFQPFFTTKPTGQGTGLGLSLSYDIVKAHGGEIKVTTKESTGIAGEETGTEFSIILPA
jgi:signal transduction histidine kinase